MVPILYESGTTSFTTNGIGKLSDCISCRVTEERNGIFEVEFTYPITGAYYSEIAEGRVITVSHDEQKDRQPFSIYGHSKPMNGVVTFYAHHISYLLNGIIMAPFTATSVSDAFNTFTHSMNANPFTFWTDNVTGGNMDIKTPVSVRSAMGGMEGSVLDVFGGEYEFDNFLVRNYAARGANNGVTIRYGKNLMDITQTLEGEFLYNAVVPFWSDNEATVVYGGIVTGTGQTASLVSVLDLSQEFDEAPTVAQLTALAQQKIDAAQPWIPKENIKVNFVALWQTEEYKDIAPLERVQLCDTVTIIYPELGVEATAKVIKVVWDALTEKYELVELGETRSSFAETVLKEATAGINELLAGVPTKSFVQGAIDHATELITGGLGGHIVFLYDANGKPTELLVMDTEDVTTAVHVLRINVNGIGFSSNGINGPYTSAWTLDGQFVADFITAGTMSFDRMQGGTLTLGGANNGNGVLVVYDASGNEIGRWDNSGINASGNFILSTKSGSVTYTGYVGSFTYFYPGGTSIASATGYGFSTQRTSYQYSVDISREVREYILTAYTSWSKTIFTGNLSSYSAFVFAVSTHDFRMYRQESTNVSQSRLSMTFGSDSTTNRTYMYIPHGQFRTSDYELVISRDYSGSDTADLASNKPYLRLGSNVIDIHCTNANTYIALSSSSANIYVSSTVYLRYISSYWYIKGLYTSGNIAVQGSSAKRYKHDITDQIDDALDPHRLYDLTMKQFVFNDDCENWQYPDLKGKTLPGFIAEDVEEIYPAAAIHNVDGEIENWDERRIIPGMLALIQEQHEEIEDLKTRLAKLESIVDMLMSERSN